jgi:hypothetical protein
MHPILSLPEEEGCGTLKRDIGIDLIRGVALVTIAINHAYFFCSLCWISGATHSNTHDFWSVIIG